MADNRPLSIKRRASRTRGSRGKRRGNKQTSATSTTSPAPSRSSSPLPPAQTACRPVLGPVLDNKCRCYKRSTYTSTATQTSESSFAAPSKPSTPTSSTATASFAAMSPSSPAFTGSPSSTTSTFASPPSRRTSDSFSVLLDLPLTIAELRDWERGIKAARSPLKRSKWSKMLQEEIRQRGIDSMGEDMVELVLKQY